MNVFNNSQNSAFWDHFSRWQIDLCWSQCLASIPFIHDIYIQLFHWIGNRFSSCTISQTIIFYIKKNDDLSNIRRICDEKIKYDQGNLKRLLFFLSVLLIKTSLCFTLIHKDTTKSIFCTENIKQLTVLGSLMLTGSTFFIQPFDVVFFQHHRCLVKYVCNIFLI